jgi:hypothetical protein
MIYEGLKKYFDGAFQVYGNYVDPRKLPKSRLIF